jgi:Rod binding domain-containing protein
MSSELSLGSVLGAGSLSSALAGTTASGGAKDSPEKVKDAATQFESLLISQILKSVHEEQDGGWMGTGEDKTAESATSLADDYFARALSAKGGLGLAKMVAKGLESKAAAE